MSRPDRRGTTVVYPNPSLPRDLVALYREHAARLPPLAASCAEGLRKALRSIGVEPPASAAPAARTAAATAAKIQRRAKETSMKTHMTGCEHVATIPNLTGDYVADLRTEIDRREDALKKRQADHIAKADKADVRSSAGEAGAWAAERAEITELREELETRL